MKSERWSTALPEQTTIAEHQTAVGRSTVVLFGSTIFLSSGLLFFVEPMFAKMALPLLGSAPSVWITCVLFFQGALLAGYASAHAGVRLLGSRRDTVARLGLLVASAGFLPIGISSTWRPPLDHNPIPWLLSLLAVSIGVPFFVLSSLAPAVQHWFAGTRHPAAGDPYFLYRASNAGSFLALLAYPTVVEATLTLHQQAIAWTVVYAVVVALVIGCSAVIWRTPRALAGDRVEGPRDAGPPAAEGAKVSSGRRLQWLLLAFVPASLMLGITSYLTTDIAPIPLLWAIPLAIYLLTFALVFGRRPPRSLAVSGRAFPILTVVLVLTMALHAAGPLWLLIPLHLATFFAAAMLCHGRLASDRPSVAHLTGFYFMIAIGGVAGGAFNALIAPTIFNAFTEYPLVLILACVLLPRAGPVRGRDGRWLDMAIPAAVFGVVAGLLWGATQAHFTDQPLRRALVFGLPTVACFTFANRSLRFGLALGAVLLAGALPFGVRSSQLFVERNFYGVNRVVVVPGGYHLLYSGTTIHGAQSVDLRQRISPLTYYARTGPVGDLFRALDPADRSWRVAIIGLGTGSMACYATPGQLWTFFELDPAVATIARDPRLFTFLRDCADGRARVVLGDARLSLERSQEHRFGLIAVDAFNSDAVPVHLLTREALRLYLSKLAPGGVIAFHISNNYLDLHPVVAALARDAGLTAYARDANVTAAEAAGYAFPSQWVVLARWRSDLRSLTRDPEWHPLMASGSDRPWTDQYSNVFRTFRWG